MADINLQAAFTGECTFTFGGSMKPALSGLYADFTVAAQFMPRIPRQRIFEPVTGKAPYRAVVVDYQGNRYGELENIKFDDSMSWALNDTGTMSFTLPANDPKNALCICTLREIQVWRGRDMLWWGIIQKRRGDNKNVQYSCVDLNWYFTRRVMGKVPTTNLLVNGSFEQGFRGWSFGYLPKSIPAAPPAHSLTTNTLNGKRALKISGSNKSVVTTTTLSGDVSFEFGVYTLTAAGRTAINAFCKTLPKAPVLRVEGNADSTGSSSFNQTLSEQRANSVKTQILSQRPHAVVTAVGYGETRPVASNATAAGRAKNRRVDIRYFKQTTAKGHRQYAGQRVLYTNPKSAHKKKTLTFVGWCYITEFLDASKDAIGPYMERINPKNPKKILSKVSATLDKDSPRNVWIRYEISMDVPADDVQYAINVRCFPPSGSCIWDECSLTASDELGFFGVDEALIVKGLVAHAQDPAMGKNSLNITSSTPLTGVKRTREYPFASRQQISEALNEFPTLHDGVDIDISTTPTRRVLRTYYPFKGGELSDLPITMRPTLVLGGNMQSYSVDEDGAIISSQIIVQADGDGSDREEGIATNTSRTDGLILETVYNATPGSSVSSLAAQARRGLTRFGHPVDIPSITMMPEATDDLLDNVDTGTIVRVIIKDGRFNIDSTYRVTNVQLDATADALTYDIVPEDGLG